ncbi:MAG: Nif3-like dinuclear metal center hexameric protein [Promethearchaeota archaeon]
MYLDQLKKSLKELFPENRTSPAFESGIWFGRQTNTSRVVIRNCYLTVDLTLDCIENAINENAKLIITRHVPDRSILSSINEIQFEVFRLLTNNNIWIYYLNDSSIAAEVGISKTLCDVIGFKETNIFNAQDLDRRKLIPIGRIVNFKASLSLLEASQIVKKKTRVTFLEAVGNLQGKIKKLLVLGGVFNESSWLKALIQQEIDAVLCGGASRNIKNACRDLNIKLMILPLFNVELSFLQKLRFLLSFKHPNIKFNIYQNLDTNFI